jgi:hypothetical protein
MFFTFLDLAWIFVMAAVPLGILVTPLKFVVGLQVYAWSVIPSTILVLPIFLVSGLANNSMWQLWHGEFIRNLFSKPLVLLIFYAMSALVLFPTFLLGYLTIMHYAEFIFLAPLTGFVWSASLLIYGRLLGRVLWVVGGEHEASRRGPRQRRQPKRLPTAGVKPPQ